MRILVVKLSSLGDLFHALPSVHAIKAHTGAEIDWVVHAAYAPLVACFEDVEHVLPFPRHALLREGAAFLKCLRAREYDLVLDFQGLLKSACVTRAARGNRRLGPSFHREGSRWFYDAVTGPRQLERHAVEQIADVLTFLDVPRQPMCFPVCFPPPVQPVAKRPHIVLAPVSRWPSKNWPTERFCSAARILQETHGATITLIGAPGEEEICNHIASALQMPCRNLAGKTSLPEMGSILADADLLLANDSGPVHMAAAIGTPVLVVFGPTDPVRIGPYGAGHQILRPSAPCRCGRRRVCAYPDSPCIASVTVEEVLAAAAALLTRPAGDQAR